MEVEPASREEFVEDIIKPHQQELQEPGDDKQEIKEVKEVKEINGNKDLDLDVKQISDTIKEIVTEDVKTEVKAEEALLKPPVDETVISNGDANDDVNGVDTSTEDANISDIKPKEESIKEDVEMEEDVRDEPMDQDGDNDPEEVEPPFENQDRSEKLEDPLFEEEIIEGFSFCAFDKYTVLEVRLKQTLVNSCLNF